MIELNKIYNEDCLECMKRIDDKSINLICTDPPYLTNYKTKMRKDKTHKFCTPILNDNNPDLIKNYFVECYRILKNDTALYSFCDINKLEIFKNYITNAGFEIRNIIIWSKGGGGCGDLDCAFSKDYEVIILANKGKSKILKHRYGSIWAFSKVKTQELIHQNQKPVDIIIRMIREHSKEGDTIFDGFAGSGTTPIACLQTNRNFIACELDVSEYDLATKRINDFKAQTSFFD